MKLSRVLLIEEESPSLLKLSFALCKPTYDLTTASLQQALAILKSSLFTLIVVGPGVLLRHGLGQIMTALRSYEPSTPVVVVAENSSEALILEALRMRVDGYVKHPYSTEELHSELRRCVGRTIQAGLCRDSQNGKMLGDSAAMLRVRDYLTRIAATDTTVLITGETGTGKELAAEFIHSASNRRDKPFVTVNCAAIPDTLLESELFGYERGAFTGANKSKDGKFLAANGGTIFLDEIGDMSPYAQVKILRTIDQREVQKLGNSDCATVNIRIVAATNQDLETLVSEKKFRKDLFFRLNVGRVHLPPLRERKEDIPLLAAHYLRLNKARLGAPVQRISDDAWLRVLAYDWPGNIRELRNVMEIFAINSLSEEVSVKDLPDCMRQTVLFERDGVLASDERERLLSALTSTNWNKSRAAERLQWSRVTLYRKMMKYSIPRTPRHVKEECNNLSHRDADVLQPLFTA